MTGRVKWFNASEGYGFIEHPGSSDIFVHYSAIQGEAHTLEPDQLVEFEVVQGPRGPMAEKVTVRRFTADVSDSSFEGDVLQSDCPVLVNFWAEWCVECRLMSQTVDAVANEFADNVAVVNLNVDENPLMTGRYCIDLVPTLILFKEGKEQQRLKGINRTDVLSGHVKYLLSEMLVNHERFSEPSDSTKSPYEILNVPAGASHDEIVSAYKQMAKMYHPDKVATLGPEFRELAEKRMTEINLAYRTLVD
jgi:thioredoxin